MSLPTSRKTFIQNCLRRLGAPVIEINVDYDQIQDRVDEALQMFWDYHFDGSDKQYYKYVVQPGNFPNAVCEVIVANSGIGYSNTDTVTIVNSSDYTGHGDGATASIVTDANGSITSVPVANNGARYVVDPIATITTSTGTGAVLQPLRGGYIPIPDNIIGIVNMFPLGSAISTNNLFNIRYQIALNDLYTLSSVSMVPYYMAMQHVQQLEQLLVGQQPLRYNRHTNRCYIDMDWGIVNVGDFILLEAYQIVDPNVYSKTWSDRWLLRYAAALIKQQWGVNLSKYRDMKLPGGISFNAQQIYDEATRDRDKLEAELISSYSLPVTDFIGALVMSLISMPIIESIIPVLGSLVS